jgi:hypothetical protein
MSEVLPIQTNQYPHIMIEKIMKIHELYNEWIEIELQLFISHLAKNLKILMCKRDLVIFDEDNEKEKLKMQEEMNTERVSIFDPERIIQMKCQHIITDSYIPWKNGKICGKSAYKYCPVHLTEERIPEIIREEEEYKIKMQEKKNKEIEEKIQPQLDSLKQKVQLKYETSVQMAIDEYEKKRRDLMKIKEEKTTSIKNYLCEFSKINNEMSNSLEAYESIRLNNELEKKKQPMQLKYQKNADSIESDIKAQETYQGLNLSHEQRKELRKQQMANKIDLLKNVILNAPKDLSPLHSA